MKRTPKEEEKWHKWFAWHPVELGDGVIVWLESIWRRIVYNPNGSNQIAQMHYNHETRNNDHNSEK